MSVSQYTLWSIKADKMFCQHWIAAVFNGFKDRIDYLNYYIVSSFNISGVVSIYSMVWDEMKTFLSIQNPPPPHLRWSLEILERIFILKQPSWKTYFLYSNFSWSFNFWTKIVETSKFPMRKKFQILTRGAWESWQIETLMSAPTSTL